MRSIALIALALLLATLARAQDLIPSAPPQDRPILLAGATIHTVSGQTIQNGFLLFDQGVIRAVSRTRPSLPGNTEVIDAQGMHIYPGLFAADTQLGLTELEAVRATRDTSETGSITPEVRAITAVNPDSTWLPVTRHNGVLLAAVFPTGGRVSGRASVIRLDGWTNNDLAISEDAGLVISWPQMRPVNAWWMDRSDAEQRKDIRDNINEINELFDLAEAYHRLRALDPRSSDQPIDQRFEAMAGVLDGSSPLLIRAQDMDQITAAVTWATSRGYRPIIVGGRDAPLVAELLKQSKVPVIATSAFGFPKRDDAPYDDAFTLPKRLEDAGLTWCLSGDGGWNERNLPHVAGKAAAFGLSTDDAIRSITLAPAEIFGLADRYGSLDTGKSATLIVTTGNPLEVTTEVKMAFIDGRRINLDSKQTELERKYREKYRQLGLID